MVFLKFNHRQVFFYVDTQKQERMSYHVFPLLDFEYNPEEE